MNHPWQQPIRPLEYRLLESQSKQQFWYRVLFMRPTDDGYEVIGQHGRRWDSTEIMLRTVD